MFTRTPLSVKYQQRKLVNLRTRVIFASGKQKLSFDAYENHSVVLKMFWFVSLSFYKLRGHALMVKIDAELDTKDCVWKIQLQFSLFHNSECGAAVKALRH